MNSQPGISIVIVNWNGIKWLKKLLDSVTHQTYQNYEVIFVDNASTDESVPYVSDHYPKVKIIKNDRNSGFAAGNNIGIKAAKNPWIMILNTDTWIPPEFVEKLHKFALTSELDVVGPREASYDTLETRTNYVTTLDLFGHPVYLYGEQLKPQKNLYLSGVCLLFSKDVYQETGGMDENFFMYFEEIDWFWRMVLMGKTFGYDPSLNVYHAGGGSSKGGLSARNFQWRNENALQMLLKNYSWYMLIIALPVYLIQNVIETIAFILLGRIEIAKTYPRGIIFNIRNIKRTMRQRKRVQSRRVVRESIILKKLYFGSGKLRHARHFILRRLAK